MTDKPSKQPKKPLDYPEETYGSRVAARARRAANKMTDEERREYFRQGMVLIYGGELKEKTGAGH